MNSNDIAKIAGVSRSTVSRVVNNYPNVPEATRKKVEAVIEQYGYVPNTMGRGLVGMAPPIIGLFILDFFKEKDEEDTILCDSPILMEFAALTSDMVKKWGYYVLVSVLQREEELEEIRKLYRSNTIRGAIIMGDGIGEERMLSLAKEGCKLVVHNLMAHSTHPNIIVVNNKNYEMAYQVTEQIIQDGHTRIAHITGDYKKLTVQERMRGMDECMQQHGLLFDPRYLGKGAYHRQHGGYQAMRQVLEQCEEVALPTALMANSVMAVGALRAIKEVGLKVPEDISIYAIDGIEESKFTSPPLYEMCVSHRLIIETAVKAVIEAVEGKEHQREYWLSPVGTNPGASVRVLSKNA
ncbi:MAG: LacI family DNA-binding transcriptional regulator [Eubacteriales bacterium]|jgi:LacI family transcriptional regulator